MNGSKHFDELNSPLGHFTKHIVFILQFFKDRTANPNPLKYRACNVLRMTVPSFMRRTYIVILSWANVTHLDSSQPKLQHNFYLVGFDPVVSMMSVIHPSASIPAFSLTCG